MCLLGQATSVSRHARSVRLSQVEKGVQPENTVLAWRVWKIEKLFPSITLRSESQTTLWTPGEPMKGDVTEKNREGVHAYMSLKDMLTAGNYTRVSKTDFKQETQVVGQVLLWGMIAKHSNGYRAQYGYPFLLYVNGPELQGRLAANYGCQVSRTFIPRLLAEAA